MKLPERPVRPEAPTRGASGTLAEFAESRGFDEDFLIEHGIYLAEEHETPWPGRWVAIPYRHLSGEWFIKYRRPDGQDFPDIKYWIGPNITELPKPREHDGRNHLYNPLGLGPNTEVVWLAEGEFDALSLISLGYPAAGVPGATGFKRQWGLLFEEATVVLAFDADQAGQAAATKLKSKVFDERALLFNANDPRDWNEWLVEDPDGLEALLKAFAQEHGI